MKESLGRPLELDNLQKELLVRSSRLKKNREARKAKTFNREGATNDIQVPDNAQSKQDRLNLQKIRNRDAAQRARDKSKILRQILEKQVEELRHQLTTLRDQKSLCSRCGDSLLMADTSGMVDENDLDGMFMLEGQDTRDFEPLFGFERVRPSGTSGFPMFITVFAVVLCLAGFAPCGQGQGHSTQAITKLPIRLLQEVMTSEDSKFAKMKTIYPIKETTRVTNFTGLVSPLIPSPQKCNLQDKLNSYVSNTTLVCMNRLFNFTKKNSSIGTHLQAIQERGVSHDVLFCEVPRIYRYGTKDNKLLGGQFTLIIDSPSMKQITRGPSGLSLDAVDQQGLYQVRVEVVSVKEINRTSCGQRCN